MNLFVPTPETAWGGPPAIGPLDGTVLPSAAAGSLAFLPADCVAVLRAMRSKWGKQAWGRFGFVDAFHPAANRYDPDVLGIDQGISVLMAENLRSGVIWDTFMRNPEAGLAMRRAGFHGEGLVASSINFGHSTPTFAPGQSMDRLNASAAL